VVTAVGVVLVWRREPESFEDIMPGPATYKQQRASVHSTTVRQTFDGCKVRSGGVQRLQLKVRNTPFHLKAKITLFHAEVEKCFIKCDSGTDAVMRAAGGPLTTYATFWSGSPPSPFERACLSSFARRGYPVTMYSYRPVDGLPEGVSNGDASDIAPEETSRCFIYGGKPNLSHFSDYFRYKLFERTSHVWIDADLLMLRPIDFPVGETLLAREGPDSICGAIMRLGRSAELSALLSRVESAMGKELSWGETGPQLLTEVFGKKELFKNTHAPHDFFPIGHNDFWRVFLPSERDWCEAACEGSYAVHLWNNIVDRLGIWKRLAPPTGSWLASRYEADGTIGMFDASYPVDVMERMVENWTLRKTGADLGIRALAGQIMPSIARSARHHMRR
jgi:hypothetical protein